MAAITGMQTINYLYDSETLERSTTLFGTYADYRKLRKDPTIALGRGLLVSGVVAGSWSVEGNEGVAQEMLDFVETLVPLREQIMRCSVGYGRVDFGWMPFEKIFATENGRITLHLKPLLHDITVILIDQQGNFNGYRQRNRLSALPIDVPLENCLHLAFDIEGSNWYGVPLLENIRAIQTSWDNCDKGAKRYDEKLAGSHFVVHYPPGTTLVNDETVENADIASQLLNALQSSGSMTLPSTTAEYVQELNDSNVAKLFEWRVELISDSSARQPAFGDRLKYLDTLKIRGMVLPERSMLEGMHGTLAEAETHASMAITHMQEIDKHITRTVNEQLVNQLLVLNFGAEAADTVRLVAAPLVDLQITFLRKLYLEIVDNDAPTIDTTSLKEQLSIPMQEKEQTDGNETRPELRS